MKDTSPVFQAIDRYSDIETGFYQDKKPIYTVPDKWYFWDETWAFAHGPFDDKAEAEAQLKRYVEWLNTGRVEALDET